MSGSRSNKRQSAGHGAGGTAPPTTGARLTRSVSLLLLVCVDLVVALLMVVSFARFVFHPDPTVKAGPMYVTLTLTTVAALLMLLMALNASFLPFVSRNRARNVQLVMWVMGATGIVTGLLTLGSEVNLFVARLALGSIAFVFISVQEGRLSQARAAARSGQAGPPAPPAQPHVRSRQRRAGRKR